MMTFSHWVLPMLLSDEEWNALSPEQQSQMQEQYALYSQNKTLARADLLDHIRQFEQLKGNGAYPAVQYIEQIIEIIERVLLEDDTCVPPTSLIGEWMRKVACSNWL